MIAPSWRGAGISDSEAGRHTTGLNTPKDLWNSVWHSAEARVNLPKDCAESVCCIPKNIG